jgi:hypothetical protein
MPSVSAPTRTGTLDNFVWWHRLRRHKVERSDTFCRNGWTNGLLSFVLHCRTCNFEWHWTIL